jgi:hypothetical protein
MLNLSSIKQSLFLFFPVIPVVLFAQPRTGGTLNWKNRRKEIPTIG